MATSQKTARPLARCLGNVHIQSSSRPTRVIRSFTSTSRSMNEAAVETSPAVPEFDPNTVTSKRGQKELMKSGVMPIGSRRRRAVLKATDSIPFEQMPYQCFQEARKVLLADREEKLKAIQTERLRISNLDAQDAATITGGEKQKQIRLASMRKHLEYLKIQADINDPMIKKRFEDGQGDMDKPIYRYLADRKWRTYQQKIIVQRIEQLGIVPDVLPYFEPTADIKLAFRQRNVQPGDFVDSRLSDVPARLKIQVFDQGERLVSVVVIDSDVPDVAKDGFSSRCHFLATNIPLKPTDPSIPLIHMSSDTQLALPWLPPFAQKGSPYHRYSVFVMQQQPGQVLDVAAIKTGIKRDGFNLRSFTDKHRVQPIGMAVFRAVWDEGTASVMAKAGIEGADVEFKRQRIAALKPKEKARGWDAKHAKAKYKPLRKER